ncbi:AP-2 complex subunit mu [Spathaspora sp. JA1]|nr:AP-2 complex subunit mu [Spathaspora sp. JA1]
MAEENTLYIPIPHYPPFKLRSSLIDKDPVIWVHLLDAYIQLCNYLLDPQSPKLTPKSQQQLQLFLKVFLTETCEEESKIFSLGAINPDIKQNTATLRVLVFQVIKNYSLVKLNLTGEAVWNFVRVYAKGNTSLVRGLVEGSFKSKFNDNKKSSNISSIGSVQKHIKSMIIQGKFSQLDLDSLSILLGQHTSSIRTTFAMGSSASVNKKITRASSLPFAESFVDSTWIESLEQDYLGGASIHANTIKQVMIISIVSLSTSKLAKLAMELGITSVNSLEVSPLFSSIIVSDAYKELVPSLEERLPFLRSIKFENESGDENYSDEEDGFEQNIEGISFLVDLFPQLTETKAKYILKENNGDVEHVTNLLLENPDLIDSIPEEKIASKKKVSKDKSVPKVNIRKPQQGTVTKRSIYDDDKISKGDFSGTTVIFGKKDLDSKIEPASADLKKKTLNAALRLIYESNEDEPDDTYEDQERTTGAAVEDTTNRKKPSGKMAVLDDEPSEGAIGSGIDERERFLFSVFKRQGPELFDKTKRKSSTRQELKKSTSWSDEQIEGWLRMLLKSPRRFKLLEEDFFYGGGNPNRRARKVDTEENAVESSSSTPAKSTSPSGSPSLPADGKPKKKGTDTSKRVVLNTFHNKMISAVFIYDSKGDILISKLFKDDVKRSIADVFRIQVITQTSRSRDSSTKSPVLTLGSTSFIYIKSGSIWICAVTRSNQDCATILEYLYKLETLLRIATMDKRGGDTLTDEALINNFNLVYEIIDESCDFGFPTNLDLSYLKNFVTCLNESDKAFKLVRKSSLLKLESNKASSKPSTSSSSGSPPPLASNITWRSQGLKYRRNEIFLRVTEKVNVLMNAQSDVVRSYIDGSIQMKTHLSGMPSCRFGFNESTVLVNYKSSSPDNQYEQDGGFVVLEDSKFHQCVDLKTFDNERVIQFVPPDGEFQLMSYNCHSSINLPFRIYPHVQDIGRNKLVYKIVIKSFFPVKLPATDVVLKIPTPKSVSSKLIQNSMGKAKYHPEEHAILWKFNKFFGGQEQVLNAEIELSGESDELLYWTRPPITLDFVLDMFSCSGLTVKFLRVQEKSNYKTLKWVKYTSQAGSYEIRY